MRTRRFGDACWLVITILVGFPTGLVRAYDYGLFVEVETEADLRDLLESQQIDQQTFECLLDLLQEGVDLQTADRAELFSLPNLTVDQVDGIVRLRQIAKGGVDPQMLLAQGVTDARTRLALLPFLQPSNRQSNPVRAEFRYTSNWSVTDQRVPSMLLFSRLRSDSIQLGLSGLLVRQRLGSVRYDPQRRALSAEVPQVEVVPAKYYLAYRNQHLQVIAGTYRIGFGQRLTFDSTSRLKPNGMVPDTSVTYSQQLSRACRQFDAETEAPCDRDEYESPDFRYPTRQRGLAVGWKKRLSEEGWLQSYGFFSYATQSVYQYEIIDRAGCAPTLGAPAPCSAPNVFVRRDDPLLHTSRWGYSTLPEMLAVILAGTNVSYFFDSRSHLGVTGYATHLRWLVEGLELDLQPWSRLPFGGPFGALGVDWAWGSGIWDLFAELTRSFDSQPSGGDWACVLRSSVTWTHHQLDSLVRYYGPEFANPYARATSAPDERDGLRARDEWGLQVRYVGLWRGLRLGGLLDVWSTTRALLPKLRLRIRADYPLLPGLWSGFWLEFVDKALHSDLGRLACYEQPMTTESTKLSSCTGEKLQSVATLVIKPFDWLSLLLAYQHRFIDDGKSIFAHSFRQDLATWIQLSLRSEFGLQIDTKLRYVREAVWKDEPAYEILSVFVQLAYRWEMGLWIQARYSLYSWMDENKNPNPAHWLKLQLAYRL